MLIGVVRASESAQLTETVEPSAEGVLSSLGIQPAAFIFQLVNFTIVAVVIWRLILKPLTAKMTERQKLIDASLEQAKKVEENLRRSEQKYQERIDEAKVETNKILERATAEAEAAGASLKEKAKQEIEQLVDQAKRNIAIERNEMVASFKQEAANLVALALEKMVAEKIDERKDRAIIEQTIARLK